jgi:hypothetical protein
MELETSQALNDIKNELNSLLPNYFLIDQKLTEIQTTLKELLDAAGRVKIRSRMTKD